MTSEEIGKVLDILWANYPRFYETSQDEQKALVATTWQWVLGEFSYGEVMYGLKAYFSMPNEYPPQPGQIKALIMKPKTDQVMSVGEAWQKVRNAISNGLYGAEQEFAKLPATIQRIVGTPQALRDMAMLDSTGIGVEQANFTRAYENIAKSEKEEILCGKTTDLLSTMFGEVKQIE